jgi:hypothetical protein
MEEEIAALQKQIDRLEGLLRVSSNRISLLEQWKAIHIGEMEAPWLSLHVENSPNDVYGRMGKTIGQQANITRYPLPDEESDSK